MEKDTNLIDLISLGDEAKGQSLVPDVSKRSSKKQSLKSILDSFAEQCDNDEDCYSDEYDVNKFVQQRQ